jgi:F0F1-type ATP synthase membrane subunit c/vacuolar-type H+-ATPase subunit K
MFFATNKDQSSMKPRTAFVAGCFILAGIGLLMTAGFGWQIASQFPSADLAEPLRQRATYSVVFSSFVVLEALNISGFLVGIALIGFAILTAIRNLKGPPSASDR